MKTTSILHIGKFYPPYRGGMETHVRDLAVRQTDSASISVIAAHSEPWFEKTVMDGVSVTRVARFGTIASMPVCPGLALAIRRTPADLVHIHMPNPAAALSFLMSGHSGKLVITHHADTIGRRILRQLSDPFVESLMRRAGHIIVTSKRYLDSSSELSPFRHNCSIVPLGIDPDDVICNDKTAIRKLRQQLGDRIVLAVGRLVPYKGFDILIRAMKDVDARLILIGSGPQYGALIKLAQSEGVLEKITMLGKVEDIRPYFAAASVFVLPSVTRAEAFGMVQLEAMSAGLPIVNTNIESGVPEVCIDGATGITVPPRNVFALSHAIQLLLNKQELRKRLGDAGKARVHAEFTSDLMARRIAAIYSDVLGIRFGEN